MSLSSRITTVACRLGLVLALSAPVSFVGAQSPASNPTAKPQPKLAPRPLPGSNSRSGQPGPSAEDIDTAESLNRSKVPLYRPASAQRPGTVSDTTPTASQQQAVLQNPDRARIVAIRRRGTFPVPASVPSDTAPALVNETGPSAVAADPMPAGLAPGKIRIIPKEMIKAGTPATPHP